jgi:hypothetical protein
MPRRRLCASLALLFLALSGPARAGFDTGAALLVLCEDAKGSGFAEMYCLGYATAVADVLERNGINGLRACIRDEGVVAGELAEVAKAYLRRHPERGGYGAAGLVADALGDAYPCNEALVDR